MKDVYKQVFGIIGICSFAACTITGIVLLAKYKKL